MPRLRVFSGREVCGIMSQYGFEQVRQRGSHIIMQKKAGKHDHHRASAGP